VNYPFNESFRLTRESIQTIRLTRIAYLLKRTDSKEQFILLNRVGCNSKQQTENTGHIYVT